MTALASDLETLRLGLIQATSPYVIIALFRRALDIWRRYQISYGLPWIGAEIDGFDLDVWKRESEFPDYRRPRGQLIGEFMGETRPIVFADAKIQEKVTRPWLYFPLDTFIRLSQEMREGGHFVITLSPQNVSVIQKALGFPVSPHLEYTALDFQGIVEGSRNALLSLVLSAKTEVDESLRR